MAVVAEIVKLVTPLFPPTITGEPAGWTATHARSPASAMGLYGSAVNAPVTPFTVKTLSEALPSFTTNNLPFANATCLEKLPAPPFAPEDTGKPVSSVKAPVVVSSWKP